MSDKKLKTTGAVLTKALALCDELMTENLQLKKDYYDLKEKVRRKDMREMENELMACCMDDLWDDLVRNKIIGSDVPPMMVADAIIPKLLRSREVIDRLAGQLPAPVLEELKKQIGEF